MTKTISEQALEVAIVADLVKGHYVQRPHSAFDKVLCLDAGPLIDFVQATQPKEWKKFVEQHKEDARAAFLKRVAEAIEADGTITVLRQGVKATGCKFRIAFFKPETSLNPETEVLYQANRFTVMRQVRYSEKTDHSLDLVVFLNGLPLLTAELKNPLNGQDVKDAIAQYRTTRDPREPVFALGRCLAHFAVDVEYVYVATHLKGDGTIFLPFNKGCGEGKDRGAGNPPPKIGSGFGTDYLWREVWARDSVLDLVQYFVQDVRDRDDAGKLKRAIIFPRYHQLESVHVRANPGRGPLLARRGCGQGNEDGPSRRLGRRGRREPDRPGVEGPEGPRANEAREYVRVHRDSEGGDTDPLRRGTARRRPRAVQPLQHAAGDRGGVHPRCAQELRLVPHLLDAAEEGEGGSEVRPPEGRKVTHPVRGREPEDDPRKGRGDRRASHRQGTRADRPPCPGDAGDRLAPPGGEVQVGGG